MPTISIGFTTLWNYTILKQDFFVISHTAVLLPYEITLFSNSAGRSLIFAYVLLPYEITLFSNLDNLSTLSLFVLLPYEITLFSNLKIPLIGVPHVLLPYEITLFSNKKTTIRIEVKFYYLMKLHYSQTVYIQSVKRVRFYYLMKLHYSQTFLDNIF